MTAPLRAEDFFQLPVPGTSPSPGSPTAEAFLGVGGPPAEYPSFLRRLGTELVRQHNVFEDNIPLRERLARGFNVATLFIPGVTALKGLKTASTAYKIAAVAAEGAALASTAEAIRGNTNAILPAAGLGAAGGLVAGGAGTLLGRALQHEETLPARAFDHTPTAIEADAPMVESAAAPAAVSSPSRVAERRVMTQEAPSVAGEVPSSRTAATTQVPTPADFRADQFDITDPAGVQRLHNEMARVVAQRGGNGTVTWDETRTVAHEMELDVDHLAQASGKRLVGEEVLAIRNIVSRNLDTMQSLSRTLTQDIDDQGRAAVATRLRQLDAQNQALLARYSTARSQFGRDLQSLKIAAMRDADPVVWVAKATDVHGGPLDAEQRAAVVGYANELRSARASGNLSRHDELLREALGYVGSLRSSSTSDKLTTFYRTNLLTNPVTHVANILGNTSLAALETAKDVPAALVDRLVALATKQRSVTAPTVRMVEESWHGAQQGIAEAKLTLKGLPLDDALVRYDIPKETQYQSALLNAYTHGILRSLAAPDRVFRQAALRASIANQAHAVALTERAANVGERVTQLLAAPSDDMVARAISDAEIAVVADRTAAGDLLRGISQFAPAGVPLGKLVVPFTRTPGAVATRLAEYSPIGLVGSGVKTLNIVRKALQGTHVPPSEQRVALHLLGRGMTGTGVIAVGAWLRSKGLLSGLGDATDRGQRDTRQLAGLPGGAVRIGDTMVEIGRLNPLGNLLVLGATLWDLPKQTNPVGALAAGTVRTVADQPFLTGIEDVLHAKDAPGSASDKVVANILGGFVPASAGVAATARATDPYQRDAATLVQRLIARIPEARQTLPASLDQFGQPSPGQAIVDAVLNPLRRTKVSDDPVTQELTRLGVDLARRHPTTSRDAETTRRLVRGEGPVLERVLRRFVTNPHWNELSDAEKRERLEQAISRVRSQATRALSERLSHEPR